MSEQTDQRTCRFPGCTRAAMPAEAETGRPPEYCDDPQHTRASAWRARRRLTTGDGAAAAEARPVDAARQRASEITGQVAGMIEHLGEQLTTLVQELHTVGDPDAVEAQIESMSTEAAEQVAAANARATRAEQSQRRAEAEKDEADAAASEATRQAEDLTAALSSARGELDEARVVGERLADEAAQARAKTEAAQAEADKLRTDLEAVTAQLARAEEERDAAAQRADVEEGRRIDAEQRAATAETRADAEAARAERAETETTGVREELETVRTDLDRTRDSAADLRGSIAALTAERDAATSVAERERTYADERVGDLRGTYDRQIEQLRTELDQLRNRRPARASTKKETAGE